MMSKARGSVSKVINRIHHIGRLMFAWTAQYGKAVR